ncbi:MAG: HAD family phosphatase [Pedobacter sp.]|nr:HAD family phosphatase [Pedobacter sp.]MDQ8051672.1 HAD family phosphatase [Pedobacter sp.]
MQPAQFKPKAFLFDLNGTMINDMGYHTEAWHAILTQGLGARLSYDEVKKEMYGKNEELLVRVFGKDHFSPAALEEISFKKEKAYQQAFLPHLKLIDGLHDFLEKAAQAGIKMAIGSAAIPFNIDFVLDGLDIRHYFKAIVSAHDVEVSKPNAETFLKAAAALGVSPADCLVFEDVPKGAESAHHAGMKCMILTTTHQTEEFAHFDHILRFLSDYNDPILNELF